MITRCFLTFITLLPLQTAPRGYLILDGGGQSLVEIRRKAVELAGGPEKTRMLLVPHASSDGVDDEVADILEFWRSLSIRQIDVLDLRDRNLAIEQIGRANFIWMIGGDQGRLVNSLQSANVVGDIQKRYYAGAIVGGTSAGAAASSKVMISGTLGRPGTPDGAKPRLHSGLGLFPAVIVDQHFSERKRMDRLSNAVRAHPDMVGLGIDEATAVVVAEGSRCEIIGRGCVTLIERDAVPKNCADEQKMEIELRIRTIPSGESFSLPASALVEVKSESP